MFASPIRDSVSVNQGVNILDAKIAHLLVLQPEAPLLIMETEVGSGSTANLLAVVPCQFVNEDIHFCPIAEWSLLPLSLLLSGCWL
jgi:hypothetical protein